MTNVQSYQNDIAERMSSGVNYLLKSEGVLTAKLASKINRVITVHAAPTSIRTYGELCQAAANGYLSEEDARELAHRLTTQLVDAVKQPVDDLLAIELSSTDIGSSDGLWHGMTWLDDDPNLVELRKQADVM